MLSIRGLIEEIGSFEGEVVVRQWNPNRDDYDFEKPLYKLSQNAKARDLPIKYMYADLVTRGASALAAQSARPVLFIEVDRQ